MGVSVASAEEAYINVTHCIRDGDCGIVSVRFSIQLFMHFNFTTWFTNVFVPFAHFPNHSQMQNVRIIILIIVLLGSRSDVMEIEKAGGCVYTVLCGLALELHSIIRISLSLSLSFYIHVNRNY